MRHCVAENCANFDYMATDDKQRERNRRSARRHREKLKVSPDEPTGNDGVRGVSHRTLEQVAEMLGVTTTAIRQVERRAFHKIRNDSRAVQLFAECMESGGSSWEKQDETERLLDLQLDVGNFYRVYDELITAGAGQEALNCVAEIAQCQQALGKAIEFYTKN